MEYWENKVEQRINRKKKLELWYLDCLVAGERMGKYVMDSKKYWEIVISKWQRKGYWDRVRSSFSSRRVENASLFARQRSLSRHAYINVISICIFQCLGDKESYLFIGKMIEKPLESSQKIYYKSKTMWKLYLNYV